LQGSPYDIEHRIIANGTVKWVREKALLKFDSEGKPLHGIGTVQDITDHKKFVEALEQGEMWLRSIFRVAPVGIGVVSGRVLTMVNTRMCEMVGYSREELLGQNVRMLYPTDEDYGYVGQEEHRQIHEKGMGTVETRFRRKDGQFIDVLLSSTPLYPNDPSKAITFTALDITDRKVSENAIRFERDKAQQYLDIAEVMLVALDRKGQVTLVNNKGCRILGFREDEIVGKDWFETFLPERGKVHARKAFSKIMAGRVASYERVVSCVVCRDGEEKLVEWHNTVLRDEAGAILGTLSSGQDISVQRRVERALQKSEASLKRAQEVAHVGSWRVDVRTRRVEWSDETYRIFGVPMGSPLDQACFFSHVHPDDLSYVRRLWHAALGGTPYEAIHRIIAEATVKWVLDRAVLEFNAQGEPVCAVGTVQDITNLVEMKKQAKQREAEMLHLSRLSTLGEMATEFAHELNQPLSAIISYGGACLRQAESPTPDLARMARNQRLIQEQALRAREIMRQIRRFAKRRQPDLRKVNLGEPIANAVSLLRWEFRHKNIGLKLNVADEKTVIHADAIQIEQVVVNLLQNAVEAMEQSGPPCCVTIKTEVAEANQVQVIVSDTGAGVSKENMSRLFKPFFTTKSTGVGLGLSTSRSIIEMHDGTLEANRNSDGGMTFVLTLPMAPPQEQRND